MANPFQHIDLRVDDMEKAWAFHSAILPALGFEEGWKGEQFRGFTAAGTPEDHEALLGIWLRSVRATHHFLSEADIDELFPIVRDAALPSLELWVLCSNEAEPMGSMGLSGARVEALFIDPSSFRLGGGKRLLDHARALKGALTVDVNEQNPQAVQFYQANGFEMIGRSERDIGGRPFPLLHMREIAKGVADAG